MTEQVKRAADQDDMYRDDATLKVREKRPGERRPDNSHRLFTFEFRQSGK